MDSIFPNCIAVEFIKLLSVFYGHGKIHSKLHLIWFKAYRHHLFNNLIAASQDLLYPQSEGWIIPKTRRLLVFKYLDMIWFQLICGDTSTVNLEVPDFCINNWNLHSIYISKGTLSLRDIILFLSKKYYAKKS